MAHYTAFRTYRLNRLISNTCIGTAVGVYGAWNYSNRGIIYEFLRQQQTLLKSVLPTLPSEPNPRRIHDTLTKYFLLKTGDSTNYASWIGSAFSHQDFYHILFNLFTWSSFAPTLYMLPTHHFAILIFGSAVASAGTWLYDQRKRQRSASPWNYYTNKSASGSSGIVSGLLATVTMFAPTARIAVLGIIPAPLWISFGAYLLVDTYMMQSAAESQIGHSAHVGGAAFGVLYYTLFLRRFGGIFGRRY